LHSSSVALLKSVRFFPQLLHSAILPTMLGVSW
jgi:hypothetical protein